MRCGFFCSFHKHYESHLLFSLYLEDSLPPVTVVYAGIIRLHVNFFFIYMGDFQSKTHHSFRPKAFSLSHSSHNFFPSGILIHS